MSKVKIRKAVLSDADEIANVLLDFYNIEDHEEAKKIFIDEQKKEFEKAFAEYFLQSFSSRLAEYSNPIINVDSKKKINENYTIVSSTLAAKDKRPEVKINWRV